LGAPEWLEVFSAAERPDIWDHVDTERTFRGVWPRYNLHGNNADRYFGALYPTYAHLQALLVDHRSGRLAGRARTIPFPWDGTLGDLPPGIDAMGLRAVEQASPPTALSALAVEIAPDYQGMGLSRVAVQLMAVMARSAGLTALVAPVRPSWKYRYPLAPIQRYAAWERDDALPFDPWLRVHARLGGRVLRCEPRSMQITAPVADWEGWTNMAFPEDGQYVFPAGLAPLSVADGVGTYWEPNVWVAHEI
jgi:GNAT superfamily N-acetyltransferase